MNDHIRRTIQLAVSMIGAARGRDMDMEAFRALLSVVDAALYWARREGLTIQQLHQALVEFRDDLGAMGEK